MALAISACSLSASALRGIAAGQPIAFLAELGPVLETAIDRGKADIGHLIQFLEFGHDHLADHHGLDLALTGGAQAVLDPPQSGLYLLDADRTLFQSAQQTGAQLVLIEGLAATVLLDDAR